MNLGILGDLLEVFLGTACFLAMIAMTGNKKNNSKENA